MAGVRQVVKNQYFGDKRDLFKYDIIARIITTESFFLRQFLFIPMLTPNDSSWDGELKVRHEMDELRNNGTVEYMWYPFQRSHTGHVKISPEQGDSFGIILRYNFDGTWDYY